MRAEKRIMSAIAFDFAAKQTRSKGRAYAAARDVLVNGMGSTEAASVHGTTKQNVNRAVNRIVDASLRLGSCPMCGRKH